MLESCFDQSRSDLVPVLEQPLKIRELRLEAEIVAGGD